MRLIPVLAVLALAAGPLQLFAADHDGHDHSGHDHAGHNHADHHDDEKPPHDGILKEVSGGHLELVHDATAGSLTLYVLDEKLAALAIPGKPLVVQAKPTGATALVPVTLAPATADQASEFSGSADALKAVTSLEVIVRLTLDGKSQRVVFATRKSAEAEHTEGDGHKH